MTGRLPAIPALPSGIGRDLSVFLAALKERLEVREGLRGDALDRAATLRELQSAGVVAVSSAGVVAAPSVSSATGGGASAVAPDDVTGFAAQVNGSSLLLSWAGVADAAWYQVRWNATAAGAAWTNSAVLIDQVSSPASSVTVPTMDGAFLIKAVNASGVESLNAALVVSGMSPILGLNVVVTVVESPTFAGTKTGCAVVGSTLQLAADDFLVTWPSLAAVSSLRYGLSGLAMDAVYGFANAVDLGAVYPCRLSPSITVGGESVLSFMSAWDQLALVGSLSGDVVTDRDAWIEFRATADNPAGSPLWSSWARLSSGEVRARAFQFRCRLLSLSPTLSPVVSVLGVSVDMPDRVAGKEDVYAPTTGVHVSYTPAFKAKPAMAITGQGLATGDYWVVSNHDSAGFDIVFKDAAGTAVARSFDWLAKGYGYQA